MSEKRPGRSLGSFWKRSVKAYPIEELIFLTPNKLNPPSEKSNSDGGIFSVLTKKQERRAQVRRAQIAHRQRKKHYVKHLEQDVITWRQKVATVEEEAISFREQNASLRALLATRHVPTSTTVEKTPVSLAKPKSEHNALRVQKYTLQNSYNLPRQNTENPKMIVRVSVEGSTNITCLQIQQQFTNLRVGSTINSPEMFNFPAHDFGSHSDPKVRNQQSQSQAVSPTISSDHLQAEIAVNFILALEHPCRTHFHQHPATFNPSSPTTNHELMASTSMYACAPSYAFEHTPASPSSSTAADVAWDLPALSSPLYELNKLREMNDRLPKDEDEVTPVQAWFLLVERYDVKFLLRSVEDVKRELCGLVDCFAFGAAMDKRAFWEASERAIITATMPLEAGMI